MIDHSWETDKNQLEDLPLFNVDYMVNFPVVTRGEVSFAVAKLRYDSAWTTPLVHKYGYVTPYIFRFF